MTWRRCFVCGGVLWYRSTLKTFVFLSFNPEDQLWIPLLEGAVRVGSVNMRLVSLVGKSSSSTRHLVELFLDFWLLEKLTIAPQFHLSCPPSLAPNVFKAHLVFFRNAGKALGTICHFGFFLNCLTADVFTGIFGSFVLEETLHTLHNWPC